MKLSLFSIILIALIAGVATQQTFGQLADFYTSTGWINTIAAIQENQIVKNALGRAGSNGRSTGSQSRSSGQSTPYAVPAYRRYPAVQFRSTGTRLTLQEYLDSTNMSSQEKSELKQLVLSIFKSYEAEAATKGYPNDWALAFVSYIGLNSHIYQGRTQEPLIAFEQNVGLRDIVAEYMSDRGVFNNVTDRQKQELYELLIIISGLTYHYYEKALAANSAEEIRNCKLQAASNLKLVGIKP